MASTLRKLGLTVHIIISVGWVGAVAAFLLLAISALTSIIEPVMMISVGIMVGIIVISMYLPMFKMVTLVH